MLTYKVLPTMIRVQFRPNLPKIIKFDVYNTAKIKPLPKEIVKNINHKDIYMKYMSAPFMFC